MENRSPSALLDETIQLLEIQHEYEEQSLKEQFFLTYEYLKPINLLRNTLHDVATSPFLLDNLIGATVGLATGYLSRKIVTGASGNIIRKFVGFLTQMGVTNSIAQHPETVRSIGQFLFGRFLRKNRVES